MSYQCHCVPLYAVVCCRSGHIQQTLAVRLSEYLIHEQEYLPFSVYESALEHMEDLYAKSDDLLNFNVSITLMMK